MSMAFSRLPLRGFLQHAKRGLTEAVKGNQKVNIVIGNESADLDSFTCSVLYAYIRSITPPPNAFAPLYIPILNIPSSGLRLRPELTAVCKHADIPSSSLITLDDLPDPSSPLENVSWFLVDHNKLQGDLGKKYSANVHGVLDHHDEEHAVPEQTDPEPRIIEKCGSCTSLVVRYCRNSWDTISDSSLSSGAANGQGGAAIDDGAVTQAWDAQIAKMAIASILIDTGNLKAPGKVEDVDEKAVEYLETKISSSSREAKRWNRDDYYQEISAAKTSIGDLTINEILTKDYKQWTEHGIILGISSVVKSLGFLNEKANGDPEGSQIDKELDRFMCERNLDVFAIMTAFLSENGRFKRELLVQTKKDKFSSALNKFADQARQAFQLEEMSVPRVFPESKSESDWMWQKIWRQKDLSKSRKQVAPLLREAIGKL